MTDLPDDPSVADNETPLSEMEAEFLRDAIVGSHLRQAKAANAFKHEMSPETLIALRCLVNIHSHRLRPRVEAVIAEAFEQNRGKALVAIDQQIEHSIQSFLASAEGVELAKQLDDDVHRILPMLAHDDERFVHIASELQVGAFDAIEAPLKLMYAQRRGMTIAAIERHVPHWLAVPTTLQHLPDEEGEQVFEDLYGPVNLGVPMPQVSEMNCVERVKHRAGTAPTHPANENTPLR
ncbi:MAG: hypothetical protein K2Q12_01460 [Rickettsiales bacterium]|nr:hypothetical protein [Rickettsiales bacterium]